MRKKKKSRRLHTHGNSKYFGVISFVIVAIEGFFANSKGCHDCQGVVVADSSCCKATGSQA